MELPIALATSFVFALVCRNAIAARPALFYILAVLAAAAFASHALMDAAPALGRLVHPYFQRCLLAFGLLSVVMFIGALPDGSRLRRYLVPVRGELSVIAAILAAGHVINYLGSYLDRFMQGLFGMPPDLLASFSISCILVALFSVLAISSLSVVRRSMRLAMWKHVQKLAYPFFFLIYAHLLLILMGPASGTSGKALGSIVVYTVVMLAYALLRGGKALADRRAIGATAGRSATEEGSIA